MRASFFHAAWLTLLRRANAATFDVIVGPGPHEPKFTPDTVQAEAGDILAFHFGAGHDVSHGSFESPCEPVANSFWSGEPTDGSVFNVQVNDTSPIWIYCSVPYHCQAGMAMVVNAPSNESLQAYKDAAANVSATSGRPTVVAGGMFSTSQTSSSSSASSAPAATSATSGTSSTAPSATPTGNSGARIAAGTLLGAGLAAAVAMAMLL